MTTQQVEEFGFTHVKEINGVFYAICRFIFTTGLVVGIDEIGYESRYCYLNHVDAVKALEEWDGIGDPPGNWIKQKGAGDRSNPNYEPNI
tara:strand:+ start:1819 stop:2088 length:270 start_codon:yes stop_codon:yes gene_type:complete